MADSTPAIAATCSCGHPLTEHYAYGCGWCICKVAGTATEDADQATDTAATEHSDNCLSWHGPPNLCDCGVGGFASDGIEIRGLSLSATASRHADGRSE